MVGPREDLSLPLILACLFRGSFLLPLLDLRGFRGRLSAMPRCQRCTISRGEGGSAEEGDAAPFPRGLVECSACWGGGGKGNVKSTVTVL